MKYFKVKFSHDLKIVGTSGPQIQGIDPKCKYHVEAPFSFRKIKLNEPIKELFRMPDMFVTKKAKWTDLMSCTMMDFWFRFVSSDVYDILHRFKIEDYQSIDIKLAKSNIIKIYKGIYFFSDHTDTFINWEESSFGLVKNEFSPIVEIFEKYTFQNIEQFRKQKSLTNPDREFKLKNLTIRYNRNIELDFFKCRYPIYGHYCSERFKDKILEENFTGFRFEELKDLEESSLPIDSKNTT